VQELVAIAGAGSERAGIHPGFVVAGRVHGVGDHLREHSGGALHEPGNHFFECAGPILADDFTGFRKGQLVKFCRLGGIRFLKDELVEIEQAPLRCFCAPEHKTVRLFILKREIKQR